MSFNHSCRLSQRGKGQAKAFFDILIQFIPKTKRGCLDGKNGDLTGIAFACLYAGETVYL